MPSLVKTLIAAGMLLTISGGVLAAYFLTGRTRDYLYYLGLAFLGLTILLFTSGIVALLIMLAVLAAFVMTLVAAVIDTKARIAQFRQEQQEREEAFAELVTALAQRDEDADVGQGQGGA